MRKYHAKTSIKQSGSADIAKVFEMSVEELFEFTENNK